MSITKDIRQFLNIHGAGKLLSAMLLYGIGTGILAPMNANYLRDGIHLSKVEIVSIFALTLLLNMIITITVGSFSDRMKSKKTIPLIAAVICMSGLVLYMHADGYGTAMLGMVLASAPSGMIMGQLFAMARNHFTKYAGDIVEMAQLWLRASFSVGFFMGLLLGANLFLVATFKGVLWGNLAGYLFLFLILLSYREVKIDKSTAQKGKGEPFSLLMLIALLMISTSDAIRGLYLPLVVNELFGKPQLMSYLWSAQAVFELLFMTVGGYWAAKYGSIKIIWIGSLSALLVFSLYSSSPPLIWFFIAQPFYSFFVSILYGVAMGYVQRMFINHTGFGASLYVFISQTASFIGYFLPLVIKGITPHIFLIPLLLVVLGLILIVYALMREKQVISAA